MTLRLPLRTGGLRTHALASVCVTALATSTSATALAKPHRTEFPEVSTVLQGGGAAQQTSVAPNAGALERFQLRYAKAYDAAIRDLGIEMIRPGDVRAWLSDDSGRAPLTLRATWRNLHASPGVEHVHLSARCVRKHCRLGSVAVRSDKVPLLAGFVIHNLAGAKNIERVGIVPERQTGPNRQVTYFANFDTDGGRAYTVDVNIILVDPSVVTGQFNASARSKPGTGLAKVPLQWENGLLALQGFDVRFLNGPHELQQLAVLPVKGNNSVKAVHFSDTNKDDPIEAKLWWADLRGASAKVVPNNKPLPRKQPNNPGPKPTIKPGIEPGKTPTPKNRPKAPTKKFPGPGPTKKF